MALNINHQTDSIVTTSGALTLNGNAVGGGAVLRFAAQTSNVTVGTSFTDMTGLSFTAVANTTYKIDFVHAPQTAAANRVPRWCLTIPSGTISGSVVSSGMNGSGNSAAFVCYQTVSGDATLSTGSALATANTSSALGSWIVQVGGTGGTIQLQMLISGAGRTITAAGNFLTYIVAT